MSCLRRSKQERVQTAEQVLTMLRGSLSQFQPQSPVIQSRRPELSFRPQGYSSQKHRFSLHVFIINDEPDVFRSYQLEVKAPRRIFAESANDAYVVQALSTPDYLFFRFPKGAEPQIDIYPRTRYPVIEIAYALSPDIVRNPELMSSIVSATLRFPDGGTVDDERKIADLHDTELYESMLRKTPAT
jgi:hypothetical protein